ncbi:hypothetical protein [uncultured Clostridium sp.]|uniref:hypothetical protein n=1 Tax=uncultured Clostridium sp. TaxID=59620 RepID=UPI003216D51B
MFKYDIVPTKKFIKDMKYYTKKKNYYKLKNDVNELVEDLQNGNLIGYEVPNMILPLGEDVYKVRMVNSTTKVGKLGGFRIIYYVVKNDLDIYLLTIYEKADVVNVSQNDIANMITQYCS